MSLLIIIGITLLVLGMTNPTNNIAVKRMAGILRIAGILVVILGIFSSAIRMVEPGKVGVKSLFGKVQPATLSSGLNIINPLAKVELFDITTQSYTMSGSEQERSQQSDGPIRVLSADGLEVTIDMTVLYHVNPRQAPAIRREIGPGDTYIDKIVRPTARTRIRDNAVMYNAIDLYSKKRDEFQANIFESIRSDFEPAALFLKTCWYAMFPCPNPSRWPLKPRSTPNRKPRKCSSSCRKRPRKPSASALRQEASPTTSAPSRRHSTTGS
nr:prohibitin family protein [Chlorobium phaeovibrioides]